MRHLLGVLAVLAACSSSTAPAPSGPLKVGVVSGQNQSVGAGAARLPAPVVGKLVRLANGSVAFRWLNRAVDVAVPRAYAQGTVLQGAPVVGAVVCAKSINELEPAVPCTNTDVNGQVTFVFAPGTKAGTALAVVQGMNAGVVATYDTARATVVPDSASLTVAFGELGPVVWGYAKSANASYMAFQVHPADNLDLLTKVSHSGDKYGNPIDGASLGWTLTPLTQQTFTMSGQTSDPLPAPPTYSPATAQAHPGSVVTGFQPGYEALTIFANGRVQATVLMAVYP